MLSVVAAARAAEPALDAVRDSAVRVAPAYRAEPVAFARGASYLTSAGLIRIVGYNDMQALFDRWDEAFTAAHPDFHFELALSGTKAAAAALTKGDSAMAPMGAEFYESDVAAYQKAVGSYPLQIRVAHDSIRPVALSSPIAIWVPAANPLSALSQDQLVRLFTTGGRRGPIRTWGELGLTGAWADRPIRPYGLSLATALGYFMQKHHFGGAPFRSDAVLVGRSGEAAVKAASDPDGIAFSVLNAAAPGGRIVPLLPAAGGAPLAGSEEDLVSGEYPLDRFLLIYVRQPVEPWIRDYLNLVLSREGQAVVARDRLGYLPLNRAELAAERAKLELPDN